LLKEMQNTVNRIISYAASDCDIMSTEELTHKYQAQVSLIGIQFKWTSDSEDALYRAKQEKGIIKATNKKHQQRLTDLVAINMRSDQDLMQFGKWTRKKVETMILVDVHQRDVFVDIEIHRVRDPEDFEWQKQARFYWRHDLDVAQISIADVDFPYTNEYLGVKERLVITPLTDRCYVTLSQALGMCLGGAPAGPAGTGKTETTKDMGCTLGKFVMVTNCGDQMDFRALGGIYKGAAMGKRPLSGTLTLLLSYSPHHSPVHPHSRLTTPLCTLASRASQRASGRASTSSTASTWRCSPSPPSRSARS
ncbi:MAG: hypothetical protein CBC49_004120, partial [Alphaproteobacteria bacterium TMED89]